ncbi:MAG: lamin tail domain-containing protein [Planctomycetes bacterium]|nr:lamin tail domain-containing protein [Planctomycetota bacterium]
MNLLPSWLFLIAVLEGNPVVINEIHYAPADKTAREEFLELHNNSDTPVDLSGWYLSGGIDFIFSPGTVLAARSYLAIAQDPARLKARFGDVPAAGPFSGRLSNDGETIILRNPAGGREDEVDYQRGFPWPTAGGAGDYSIELINPDLDNSLGGSWRLASPAVGQETTLVAAGEAWRHFKGTSEASNPVSAWRSSGFDDAGWLEGQASIGYGESFIATNLADMKGGYISVFLRKRFAVVDPAAVGFLSLELLVDDGCNAWINGVHVVRHNMAADEVPFDGAALSAPENQNFVPFKLPNPSSYLAAGENVLAIQLHNTSLGGSSDAFIDARLIARPSGGGPTPGAKNSVFDTNAPPQLRQVEHAPEEPRAGEVVAVRVKATDPDGLAGVTLEYQGVSPGAYIRLVDPAYASGWTAVAMRDDGAGLDQLAGDGIYTAAVPGSVQAHRRLVRYRITALDQAGLEVLAPYADDPQPNFAYFVYDGVPPWKGASQPGVTPVLNFGIEVLRLLPVYHLLAIEQDVLRCQYDSAYENVHFYGTLAYDGIVYDHIEFENRGEFSTYVAGKNKWRFHFHRGHEFQARDDFGRKYKARWRTLNLNACATPWVPTNRGMAGLDESVAFKLYALTGVPSSNTSYVHFRVIDEAIEAHATDQYRGDLWGLYLAVEEPDGAFLEERGRPDGNTYKIEGSAGDKHNQGPEPPVDSSDYDALRNGYNTAQPITWWRANVDLDGYYSFRSVDDAVNNMDLREGWNLYQYHNPVSGRWSAIPWDLDMLYMPVTHWSGVMNFQNALTQHAALMIEFKNRARELQDFLFTEDQLGALVDELRAFVSPPGWRLTFADVDKAMWNYNPRTASSHRGAFYRNPSTHSAIGGTITRTLVSADHAGMAEWIKEFILIGYGSNKLAGEAADGAIPNRPTISYAGPAGFPVDNLVFKCGAFSDPQGPGTFGAMKWRIAEVTPAGAPFDPKTPRRYEVEGTWESPVLAQYSNTLQVPPGALKIGSVHRARVRMQDTSGRWSHWSAPLEFTAGEPSAPFPQQRYLRITEILYHVDADPDLEFIELKNIGPEPVDLSLVSLREGVDFAFAGSAVETLAPGALAVVAKDLNVFEARLGSEGIALAGAYSGSLSNGGDRISLVHGQNAAILDFVYLDAWRPLTDGPGYSLEIVDPLAPPESWGDPASWRESGSPGGSPGSDGSGPPAGGLQKPGDVNQNGDLEIGDAVRLLKHLFQGFAPLPCDGGGIAAGGNLVLADFDGNGAAEIADAVGLLSYLFHRGPPPSRGAWCMRIEGCPSACRF